jgi:hypothetical protein
LVFLGLESFVFLGWIVKTGFGLLRVGCWFWFYSGLDNGFGLLRVGCWFWIYLVLDNGFGFT